LKICHCLSTDYLQVGAQEIGYFSPNQGSSTSTANAATFFNAQVPVPKNPFATYAATTTSAVQQSYQADLNDTIPQYSENTLGAVPSRELEAEPASYQQTLDRYEHPRVKQATIAQEQSPTANSPVHYCQPAANYGSTTYGTYNPFSRDSSYISTPVSTSGDYAVQGYQHQLERQLPLPRPSVAHGAQLNSYSIHQTTGFWSQGEQAQVSAQYSNIRTQLPNDTERDTFALRHSAPVHNSSYSASASAGTLTPPSTGPPTSPTSISPSVYHAPSIRSNISGHSYSPDSTHYASQPRSYGHDKPEDEHDTLAPITDAHGYQWNVFPSPVCNPQMAHSDNDNEVKKSPEQFDEKHVKSTNDALTSDIELGALP
jgi:hypothetical protein